MTFYDIFTYAALAIIVGEVLYLMSIVNKPLPLDDKD